jgi:hypothetical protein
VRSKQELLASIMIETMNTLIADQSVARKAGGGRALQVRRMVEAHVRFHAANRERAFVGNREIDNLEQPSRDKVLQLRQRYEAGLRQAIIEGVASGEFVAGAERLASFAILDMGIGVATWFHTGGPSSADEIAFTHADFAIAILQRRTGGSPVPE